MEIRYFSKLLQKGWWIIVVSVLIALNISLANSYFLVERRYETSASFIVSPNIQNVESGKDVIDSLATLDKRSIIATYAEILNSRQVFNEAISFLGSDPQQYRDYIAYAVVLPEASVLQFTVQGPDPQIASALANGVGQYALDFINNLYRVYEISFVDKAPIPVSPYQPKVLQSAILAIAIGVAFGVGLIVLQDQLSSTLDSLRQRRQVDSESLALSRSSFERYMRNEISLQSGKEFTLGFVYLNGIVDLYDSLPQAYLNQIMRRVTEILQFHLRGNDVIGRWSQIQFSFLLPSTDGTSARRTMIRIQEKLAEAFSLDGSDELTVSLDPRVGLVARQGGESFQALVDQAEQALDLARQSDTKIELFMSRPFV